MIYACTSPKVVIRLVYNDEYSMVLVKQGQKCWITNEE